MRARPLAPCLALLASALFTPSAHAQLPPLDATRAGPHPTTVHHGEVMVFARSFSAARHGDRVLVVYLENAGAQGALRSALFSLTDSPTPTLTRVRDDVTLAPDARSATLAWDGTRGAVSYVVARPPSAASHAPRIVRPTTVGVPASTDDPLGPSASSGGTVMLLALDAQGAASGAARAVFTENARLWRSTLVREPDAWALAWTGATVTDDEVRGTVRAARIYDDPSRMRTFASATGFSGDVGDTLRLTREGTRTVLVFSGSRCATREGAPDAPTSQNEDPSAAIDPPSRNPQPQGVPHRAPGPPIDCAPPSLFTATLGADDHFEGLAQGPWLRNDAATVTEGRVWFAATAAPSTAVVARASLRNGALPEVLDAITARPVSVAQPVTYPAPSTSNLSRPAPDAEVIVREAPIAPPEEPTLPAALDALRAVSADGDAPPAVITADRHLLAVLRPEGPALVARTPSLLHELSVLGDASAPTILLAREGVWSGPLRAFVIPRDAAPEAVTLEAVRAWPLPGSNRTPRYPTRAPYRYDAEYARLFARVDILRAQFMRHENMAGMLAARPEAPTDPRMPGVIAVRTRLRSRWESACSQLRARASVLAREGAGDEVIRGIAQVCEIHADLQLGVPVNPAL